MPDPLHKKVVQRALEASENDHPVHMTFGELVLFHTLLQDYGLPYVGEDRFIPLMERNKARIDSLQGEY